MCKIVLEKFQAGRYEEINDYKYFVPSKINCDWVWSEAQLNYLLEQASASIGRLNSFAELVPNLDLFLQLHLTNEAVLSSRIEGTQTEIDEALMQMEDIEPEKRDDWQEVQNYIRAMNYALEALKKLPLSSRLIKETHRILLTGVRGKHRNPGEFRRSQNWIGGTSPKNAIYVPPLHIYIEELMTDLEKFMHNDTIYVPHLIRVGIIHYQFETIHPFLDGNGRIGRLLITLYLIDKHILDKPLLAMSIFFEKHRDSYYNYLNQVRLKNDMLSWLKFFLEGLRFSADYTFTTLKRMLNLKQELEHKIRQFLTRKAANALRLLDFLFLKPIVKVKDVMQHLDVSFNTAKSLLDELVNIEILERRQRNYKQNIYIFRVYLDLFKA